MREYSSKLELHKIIFQLKFRLMKIHHYVTTVYFFLNIPFQIFNYFSYFEVYKTKIVGKCYADELFFVELTKKCKMKIIMFDSSFFPAVLIKVIDQK